MIMMMMQTAQFCNLTHMNSISDPLIFCYRPSHVHMKHRSFSIPFYLVPCFHSQIVAHHKSLDLCIDTDAINSIVGTVYASFGIELFGDNF